MGRGSGRPRSRFQIVDFYCKLCKNEGTFPMDVKLPHIPDYKPSDKETIQPPLTVKGGASGKKKLSLAIIASLVVLVGITMAAVGSPVSLYKRASTAPELKDNAYNQEVYQLSCPEPNFWMVPEATSGSCDPSNESIKCGETCPADRQTGIVNAEGHQCCRPPIVVTKPDPTPTTVVPTEKIIDPPTATPTPQDSSTGGDTPCPTPRAVDELTVFCPVCQGG